MGQGGRGGGDGRRMSANSKWHWSRLCCPTSMYEINECLTLKCQSHFDPFLFPHPYLLPFKSSQLLLISPLKYVSNLFISHISTSINTRYLSPSLHIPHLDECLSSYMVSLSPLSLLQSLVHPATCHVYFFLELSLL